MSRPQWGVCTKCTYRICTAYVHDLYAGLPRSNIAFAIHDRRRYTRLMTNTIAIFFGLIILGFFAVDYAQYNWDMTTFLLRKLLDLIEYLAVWR